MPQCGGHVLMTESAFPADYRVDIGKVESLDLLCVNFQAERNTTWHCGGSVLIC